MMGLTPGTLGVDVKENTLHVHVVDVSAYSEESLRRLEEYLMKVLE